ncbi:MAG: ATP-dependent Zn protease [Actinomycetia bacterium]|nr:ATP-dependent Zn protease [Actinomycetes bacterium]
MEQMDVRELGRSDVLSGATGDVARHRERYRLRRIARIGVVLALVVAFFVYRLATGNPVQFGLPTLPSWITDYGVMWVFILVIIGGALAPMLFAGRSPHVLYRPSEISVGFDDVVGIGVVKDEVVKTLNLFLAYKTFQDRMGGNSRRAILFEGPPGTGKTYMAKAMAREAGVPFLFVSSSAFQSMYYGQTNRKIRSYFKDLRKAARREGGAIGFIEEIDAIAGARSGMKMDSAPRGLLSGGIPGMRQVDKADMREGIAGVVNELLIQMQSFDDPSRTQKVVGLVKDQVNRWLPPNVQLRKHPPARANVLVIGATNRAENLDPALLRPGRFDRSLHFDLPGRSGRREIIDYYLNKKSHTEELDKEDRRDQLAAMTFQYSPVMIEHLFDEALVWSLREGRDEMSWNDLQQAKLTEEIGLKQPVEYTEEEKCTIATHEAGHAVVAYLVGTARKLEVLSIIKRADALGLLAHSATEERFTKTRSELLADIHISFGGMTAEELFFGESGTGPGSDLSAATAVAANMVGAFGMANSLVSFLAIDPSAYGPGLIARVLGDDEGRAAVERILNQAKADVKLLLDHNRHLVVALRDALLDRDELVGDEILVTLRAAELEHAGVDG